MQASLLLKVFFFLKIFVILLRQAEEHEQLTSFKGEKDEQKMKQLIILHLLWFWLPCQGLIPVLSGC